MLTQPSFSSTSVQRVCFCEKCHKPLKAPKSIEAGMGPVCRGRIAKESASVNDLCKRDAFSDKPDYTTALDEALVMYRKSSADGKTSEVFTNVPHLVVHHSPNGYEFGYPGSGPADLALNICQIYLNQIGYKGEKTMCFDGVCFSLAWVLHQDFKRAFIADVPNTGKRVPWAEIVSWFEEHITNEMREMYAPVGRAR